MPTGSPNPVLSVQDMCLFGSAPLDGSPSPQQVGDSLAPRISHPALSDPRTLYCPPLSCPGRVRPGHGPTRTGSRIGDSRPPLAAATARKKRTPQNNCRVKTITGTGTPFLSSYSHFPCVARSLQRPPIGARASLFATLYCLVLAAPVLCQKDRVRDNLLAEQGWRLLRQKRSQ